jgi:hypothetical protein
LTGTLLACGGADPVAYSEPVGLKLKVSSGDVKGDGTVADDKSINTEVGNPFGAFVQNARAAIGGDPSDVDIDSIALLLAVDSKSVAELREVFADVIDVQFEMNDTNNLYPAGTTTIAADQEGRELAIEPRFDYGALGVSDQAKFLTGSFKVLIGGRAAPGFASLDAAAELQITLRFTAFE